MGRVWSTARHEDDLRSSDARIIDGLRRGAPAAFAGLHERYAAGIYSLALRVVRHAPDAEDITQDVLLRAFERLPKDREVLLRPWLYRLTLNRCYDYLRVSARRPPPASPGHEVVSPHDPYEQSELQGLLEAAIGDLTRRQQAALLLKDVHGLSLTEVATCLELTPGSVEVLLARARRAFRASFEERCTAAGRPLPRSAGGLAALPMVPLPAGLAAFAVPPPRAAAAVRARAPLRPARDARRRQRHRSGAGPAGVAQDGRAHRRRGGDCRHGGDRRDARGPPPPSAVGRRCGSHCLARRDSGRPLDGARDANAGRVHAGSFAVGRAAAVTRVHGGRRALAAGQSARHHDALGDARAVRGAVRDTHGARDRAAGVAIRVAVPQRNAGAGRIALAQCVSGPCILAVSLRLSAYGPTVGRRPRRVG